MKTNFKMRTALAGVVLASSGLFAAGASAAPTIESPWDWVTDGGFVVANGGCSNGAAPGACNLQFDQGVTPSTVADTQSIMSWGTGTTNDGGNGEQSALQGVFGDSVSGVGYNAQAFGSGSIEIDPFQQIVTNGGWTTIGVGIHYNNVITTLGGYMDEGTLRTTFALTSPDVQGPAEANIDFTLNETLNVAPCPGPNPEETVCDDIFTLSALLPSFAFMYNGVEYTASFQVAGGPGTTVIGNVIYTAEEGPGVAIFYTQARIDAVPVPGVLALMGMGLVMMGWRARRRKLV